MQVEDLAYLALVSLAKVALTYRFHVSQKDRRRSTRLPSGRFLPRLDRCTFTEGFERKLLRLFRLNDVLLNDEPVEHAPIGSMFPMGGDNEVPPESDVSGYGCDGPTATHGLARSGPPRRARIVPLVG
jgi:hypothetical protein